MHKIALLFLILLLSACTAEQQFRGVPETTWKQLSPEQKQLIVDKSYQDDVGK